jgi:hypothetical protein
MGIGAGHAHPQSNFKAWVSYLGPNTMRFFVPTINDWKVGPPSRATGIPPLGSGQQASATSPIGECT